MLTMVILEKVHELMVGPVSQFSETAWRHLMLDIIRRRSNGRVEPQVVSNTPICKFIPCLTLTFAFFLTIIQILQRLVSERDKLLYEIARDTEYNLWVSKVTKNELNRGYRNQFQVYGQKLSGASLLLVNRRPSWHAIVADHFRPIDHSGDWEALNHWGIHVQTETSNGIFYKEIPIQPPVYNRPPTPPPAPAAISPGPSIRRSTRNSTKSGVSSQASAQASPQRRPGKRRKKNDDDDEEVSRQGDGSDIDMDLETDDESLKPKPIRKVQGDARKVIEDFLEQTERYSNTQRTTNKAEREHLGNFLYALFGERSTKDLVKASIKAKRLTPEALLALIDPSVEQ